MLTVYKTKNSKKRMAQYFSSKSNFWSKLYIQNKNRKEKH